MKDYGILKCYLNVMQMCLCAAGVLGTAQILLQSERRGLKVSDRLGFGFSSNGNNMAYLDGSSVPINGQGLKKTEFSKIPLHDRPGPSISSSYTSSLGFTIQVRTFYNSSSCSYHKVVS